VPEGAVKVVAVLVLAVGLAALSAPSAGATNECRGLPICVRVAGPWVVVPSGLKAPRSPVDFQLSCPRGFLIGGFDAELAARLISGWQAIGFYSATPPTQALIQSVSATHSIRGSRVEARARSGISVQGVRGIVQVGAVCGGGS